MDAANNGRTIDQAAFVRIPHSLRMVSSFLEEAQARLTRTNRVQHDKIVLFCIDHAFDLMLKFRLPLCKIAMDVLEIFRSTRNSLAEHFNLPLKDTINQSDFQPVLPASTSGLSLMLPPCIITADEVLVGEAMSTLALADEESAEGDVEAAALNYHSSTIYFRVLESMVPRLTPKIHASLNYAAARTQQCSHLLENLVHEHFEGRKCMEYYSLTKKLGEGSYGTVHLCKHRQTGDEFACKVISLTKINQASLRKLHEEISIMKSVDHPNVIKLREVFFGSKTVYLIMDCCLGGELYEQFVLLSPHGLSEDVTARLMSDMFSAVRYLHAHGIIHRDLKLENFLFEGATGMNSSLKLIDFGLSKHYDTHQLMHLHHVVGSAYYMAPEVIAGDYDQRCDIWSLGVICYILLTGQPPFNGNTSEVIYRGITWEQPDYSPARFPHIRPTTLDFLQRLLEKNPEQRMTIEEALEHPFLKTEMQLPLSHSNSGANNNVGGVTHATALVPLSTSEEVLSSLGRFMKMSRYKKLLLEAVAFSLTSGQISVLRDHFSLIDTDRSGTITHAELVRYLDNSQYAEVSTNMMGSIDSSSTTGHIGSSSGSFSSSSGSSGEMKEGGVTVFYEDKGQDAPLIAPTDGPSSLPNNDEQTIGGCDIHTPDKDKDQDQSQFKDDTTNHEDNNNASASAALLLIREKYLGGMSTVEINYSEFLAAAMCRRVEIDEERLILAFQSLDVEGKGYLDAAAIRRTMGTGASEQEVEDMLVSMGAQSNGRINYIMFVKFWARFMTTQMLSPKQHFQSAVKRTVFALRLSKQPHPPPHSPPQPQPQLRQPAALQHVIGRCPSIMSGEMDDQSSASADLAISLASGDASAYDFRMSRRRSSMGNDSMVTMTETLPPSDSNNTLAQTHMEINDDNNNDSNDNDNNDANQPALKMRRL